MKKGYLAAGVVGGAVGATIAWKMLTRAPGINWDDVSEQVIHSDHSKFVEIDGLKIHFQEFGKKSDPTLLFIHGFTASTYSWHKVVKPLAEAGFHVLALDLVGMGFSSKPSWFDYSIVSQARVVTRFMNRLGIGRAVVTGCSYGGAIAATIALDYPEYVEKLILVDAVINDEIMKKPILRFAGMPGVGEVVSAFITDSKALSRKRMTGTLSPANHHLITDERVDAVTRPLNAADAHHSALLTIRRWSAKRIEHDASLINHPTLILWGEDDQVTPLKDGETLHQKVLHSRLVVFRNCGHVPQEEKPEDFVEVVSEFIKDKKSRIGDKDSEKMRIEA